MDVPSDSVQIQRSYQNDTNDISKDILNAQYTTNNKCHDATDENDSSSGEGAELIPTLDTYQPREPSYTKANSVPFHTLCKRFDVLWRKRRCTGKKAVSKDEQLKYLLPDSLFNYLEGGSPYPFMRLICPDHDSSRPHTGLKEATIAKVWGDAMGLPLNSNSYKKLTHYRNPQYNGTNAGDLSVVVHQLAEDRLCNKKGSNLTVGEMNDWLDVLVDIVKDKYKMITSEKEGNSTWKTSLKNAINEDWQEGKKLKKHDKYVKLLEKLMTKNLSPIEHKWMVRILLQRVEIGMNFNSILDYYSPHAKKLYSAFNNMEELCKRLSDPKYVQLLKITHDQNTRDIIDINREIWRPQSLIPPEIQKTVSPMLSHRTSFESYLKDISLRHHELDKVLPVKSSSKSCLALKHPAFMCEIKMDGERMLVHMKRGQVTMHTRRNVWYSPLYSPALGPALRAAISKYDVDVIFDGEVLAWDANENKAIPFGTNRAVAELRRYQRVADGTLDERDCNLHKDTRDGNVMSIAKEKMFTKHGTVEAKKLRVKNAPNQYYLKYVIFDILYVDGPGAEELLSKSMELFPHNESINTGSIVNYDLMRRKSILYNLIDIQKYEVELIPSIVIRSDGTSIHADDYFSDGILEYGYSRCAMDSILLAICDESKTTTFDLQRCSGRNHEDIEVQRSIALEQCYREIVEAAGSEGLVLKDLSSPYYLGAASRSLRYWYKLKPDYDASGQASDIDVLVLGGKYADGFRQAGFFSSLLVGIIDDRMGVDENIKYLTLCKVHFNSKIEQVMKTTGFQKADNDKPPHLGKWFEASENSLPEFISEWSFQRSSHGDNGGWRPKKQDHPDVWINPEDSFVLTINSAEIIASDSMSAGLCLRFPRITGIRAEGFDQGPKPHNEVQTFTELSTLFAEKEDDQGADPMQFDAQTYIQSSRFMTSNQLESTGKQKRQSRASRKQISEVKTFHIPEVDTLLSRALDGLTFTVLPGNYYIETDSIVAVEAEENGWLQEARSVTCREDVIRFIKLHGGKCELSSHTGSDYILGGTIQDPKVKVYNDLINVKDENAIIGTTTKRYTDARRFFDIDGIIKWTFPFSMVMKFLKSDVGSHMKSIKQTMPSLAQPRRAEYLLMTKSTSVFLNDTEDEYGVRINDLSNAIDFRRALEIIDRQHVSKKRRLLSLQGDKAAKHNWLSTATSNFDRFDCWVFRGKLQKLWPYEKDADWSKEFKFTVVYLDVFINTGFEEEVDARNEELHGNTVRWDTNVATNKQYGSELAVLPLLQIMGAVVSAHLHDGVTHILCEMKSKQIMKWTSTLPRSIFANTETGSLLHERLLFLEESAALSGKKWRDVMLISPKWVEGTWNA